MTLAIYAAARVSHDASPCYLFNILVQVVIAIVIDKSQVTPTHSADDPTWNIPEIAVRLAYQHPYSHDFHSFHNYQTNPGPGKCGVDGNFHLDDPHMLGSTGLSTGNHSSAVCAPSFIDSFNNHCVSFASYDTDAGITYRFFDVGFGAALFVMTDDEPPYPLNTWTFYESWYFPGHSTTEILTS
jgi:hypothetical protein